LQSQFNVFNSDITSRHYNEIKTAASLAANFRQMQQLEAIFSISFFIQLTTYLIVIIHLRPDLSTGFLKLFLDAFPACKTGRNLLF
jgi:hypothetical protein